MLVSMEYGHWRFDLRVLAGGLREVAGVWRVHRQSISSLDLLTVTDKPMPSTN